MALPTKQKTWSVSACNRIIYSSLLVTVSTALLGIKNYLITMSGVTVKGSSSGGAGAMDATDRWVTAANVQTRGTTTGSNQSWIVLKFANMGNAELLITYLGSTDNVAAFYFSPGGNYAAAATATQKPTATDEVTIRTSVFTSSTTSGDRLWSAWITSDGSALMFGCAAGGAWELNVGLQLLTSRVDGSITYSPAAVGWAFGSQGGVTGAFGSWSNTIPKTRINPGTPVNCDCFFGVEGYKGQAAPTLLTSIAELQGGAHNMYPVNVWSETATARGAVGTLVDVWAGNANANDGDTYPNDATRAFIQVVDFIMPWGGAAVSMT